MLQLGQPQFHLILVAYYIKSIEEINSLVIDFQHASGIKISSVNIVDNGGNLPLGNVSACLSIVSGSNSFWEFSGWLAGLNAMSPQASDIIILLNDSYGRNWTIKWPGRYVIRLMAKDALSGKIASWLDNFTRWTRRINSRIVIFPSHQFEIVKSSLQDAISACMERQALGTPLHDEATTDRLTKWMTTQDGRWNAASRASRMPRIFIEHHLLDSAPTNLIAYRPRSWIGSQFYGLARKLAGERR